MGKDFTKEKKDKNGKMVSTPEETPPRGPRTKNPTTSRPHTQTNSNANDDTESSLEKASSKNFHSAEEAEATLIDRKDSPLELTTTPVGIIE